jgi:hypothetical protein
MVTESVAYFKEEMREGDVAMSLTATFGFSLWICQSRWIQLKIRLGAQEQGGRA